MGYGKQKPSHLHCAAIFVLYCPGVSTLVIKRSLAFVQDAMNVWMWMGGCAWVSVGVSARHVNRLLVWVWVRPNEVKSLMSADKATCSWHMTFLCALKPSQQGFPLIHILLGASRIPPAPAPASAWPAAPYLLSGCRCPKVNAKVST